MHRKLPRWFFPLLTTTILGLMLGACSTGQPPMQVETSAEPPATETVTVQTHALDQEQVITDFANPPGPGDPWELVNQSANMTAAQANPLLLQASELFLDQQHYSTAYTMFEQIEPSWLDPQQQLYFTLLRARYALLTGNTTQAQSLLSQVPRTISLSHENLARRLQLEIAIAAQQLDFRRAILARIELDSLLDPQQQLINQSRILNTLTREQNLFAGDTRYDTDNRVQGWIALADLNRSQQLALPGLEAWRAQYPLHPARVEELSTTTIGSGITSRQIALLLPTSSRLGRAAQAFKAGFNAAVAASGNIDTSLEYDIGAESDLVGLYYQGAVNDGADFVIGPLGRTAAQSMLTHLENNHTLGVSTLLLGEINAAQSHVPGLWGLSLSPEQDAAAIAERAISQGMRSVAVLQKNNDWGRRLADAFTHAFESKGGQVVARQGFMADRKDHTAEVKKLLRINDSDLRHQRLENSLGTSLKFSVRRRDDIDFIFLAGNTRDARRLLPLARFYRAHDLPVYATSSAFNGKFNKLTDEDLKGLQFTDLPWLLTLQVDAQNRERARLAEEKAATQSQAQGQPAASTETADLAVNPAIEHEELPYSSATLNRLYALGYSAYEAIPQLSYLQSDEWYQFNTHTMSLNMDENRNLRHQVAWGTYQADGISVSN